jgi:hypothetical protein
MRTRRYPLLGATLACVVASILPATASAASTTYSGQATVVRANVLGQSITLADTGPLPESGGAQDATLLSASVPGFGTANVLHATTVAGGDSSRAEASVADADFTIAGNHVTADFLMSRAEARCDRGKASVSGSSDIVRLAINDQSVAVTGQPNQTVVLPTGGQVVINEQLTAPGAITVNALHVTVPGLADVVISSSHADIKCASAGCSSAKDFVTGGGWITAPSGGRGTFAVAGGIKNGGFWGHLTYIDHGSGMKVKGTGVTAYSATGTTSRHIEGTAEVNGQPGFTYQADVSDNGEPGRQDTFSLRLSNGYAAAGTLQGGNIQLHLACK